MDIQGLIPAAELAWKNGLRLSPRRAPAPDNPRHHTGEQVTEPVSEGLVLIT